MIDYQFASEDDRMEVIRAIKSALKRQETEESREAMTNWILSAAVSAAIEVNGIQAVEEWALAVLNAEVGDDGEKSFLS